MATLPQEPAVPSVRRLLLIDFDWRDADWLPELFRSPGVSVRLVVGEGPQDPGVRLADMCGLPRTVDLADLTREIFDLAIVGERSSRRTQLESLLVALGTPCMTAEEYLRGPAAADASRPGVDAPLAVHAAAMEQSLAGAGTLDALVESALPDLSEPTPLEPRAIAEPVEPRHAVASLVDFPSREAREGLEDALKSLVSTTGAGTAEVHSGDRTRLKLLAQVGPDDRLLKGLVDVANEMGTPQLVTRLNDPGKGRTVGGVAVPTLQRRGVLAGASIDAQMGLESWRRLLEELRATWDREDRERSVASYPLTPLREQRWLEPAEFRARASLAVERHRLDGLRFELHRLEFPGRSRRGRASASCSGAAARHGRALAAVRGPGRAARARGGRGVLAAAPPAARGLGGRVAGCGLHAAGPGVRGPLGRARRCRGRRGVPERGRTCGSRRPARALDPRSSRRHPARGARKIAPGAQGLENRFISARKSLSRDHPQSSEHHRREGGAGIRRLPPETASRIAAGEVIERPLSALEGAGGERARCRRALDRGARGARARRPVQRRDDGAGIAADELELALERHARASSRASRSWTGLARSAFAAKRCRASRR
jgi:hypothetical protein